jgi:cytochrome c oxidase subunit 4
VSTTTEHDHADHADAHQGHPSDWAYVKIALFLAGITAVEVVLYYKNLGSANNYALLILSAIKFVMVVGYFMHLKFDNKVLRRLFTTGFILAAFCYVAYMLTLGVFVG